MRKFHANFPVFPVVVGDTRPGVLYDDPQRSTSTPTARSELPHLSRYPDGQTTPTPSKVDFVPGELLGSALGTNLFFRGKPSGKRHL